MALKKERVHLKALKVNLNTLLKKLSKRVLYYAKTVLHSLSFVINEIAEKFEVHPNQVTAWKAQLLERSSEAFGEKADGTPAPNIEKMEAKIGRLTLENDFLESALIKAGLLSANR